MLVIYCIQSGSLNSLRLLGGHVYSWKGKSQAEYLHLRRKRRGWDITENERVISRCELCILELSGRVSTEHQLVEKETPILSVMFSVTSVPCQFFLS